VTRPDEGHLLAEAERADARLAALQGLTARLADVFDPEVAAEVGSCDEMVHRSLPRRQ
jgi:hypothetical protein